MNLIFYDSTDKQIINELVFPTQIKGQVTPTVLTLHLWNRKGKVCDYTATGIKLYIVNALKLTTGGTDYQGQEIVDEKLIQARSNGVVGTGIIDDAQVAYTAIGGNTYLAIGDIPVNCARVIQIKLKSILTNTTTDSVFFTKMLYNYSRTKSYTVFEDTTVKEYNWFGSIFLGGGFL